MVKLEQKQRRCLIMFLEGVGSSVTKSKYKYELDRFMKWNKLKDYDDLLKADEKSLQRNLEDYLIYLKGTQTPNTIPSMMAPIELFYVMNDVNLNTKRLHKMLPTRTKAGGYGSYTREHITSMINNTNKKRTKSLILFFASTGCRVGVIPELSLGDITNYENCKKVVCYVNSKEEYFTFMTPEASKAFDDYLEERQQDNEKLTSESPAFRQNYQLGSAPALTMETGTVRNAISITLKDVAKKKTGNRYNISMIHGLRKFFNVSLKLRYDSNLSLCEKLMGHSTSIPLDNHYGTFTEKQIFDEYLKAIPELTISGEDRKQIQLDTKNKKLDELESKQLEVDNIMNDLVEMKKENAKFRDGDLMRGLIKEQFNEMTLKSRDGQLIKDLDEENNKLRSELKKLKDQTDE